MTRGSFPSDTIALKEISAPRDILVAQETERRGDLVFTIGVAFAFALPALLGMGVYIAMLALLRAS